VFPWDFIYLKFGFCGSHPMFYFPVDDADDAFGINRTGSSHLFVSATAHIFLFSRLSRAGSQEEL